MRTQNNSNRNSPASQIGPCQAAKWRKSLGATQIKALLCTSTVTGTATSCTKWCPTISSRCSSKEEFACLFLHQHGQSRNYLKELSEALQSVNIHLPHIHRQ